MRHSRTWMWGWAALAVLASGCGLDVTFDPSARGSIARFDPEGESVDAGVDDVSEADAAPALTPPLAHTAWSAVAGQWLEGGCVDYGGLGGAEESRAVLALYLDQLQRVDLEAPMSADERRALWINAYNASVVAGVVQEQVAAPDFRVDRDDFSFFKARRFEVGGLLVSLDQIEHGALRGQVDHASLLDLDADTRARLLEQASMTAPFDPRIHFALNCASRSCPDLRAEAFQGAQLDAQLDAQARRFLADASKGAGPAGISSLFSWFEGDFTAVAPVTEFIAQHREGGLEGVNTGALLPYDWALNGVDATHPQCR